MSHRVPRPRLSHDLYKDLERIIVDPEVMGGVPCIGGLHVSVSTVVEMTVDGMSYEEILDEIPLLEAEDIDQGLEYAARAIYRFLALPFYDDTIPRARPSICRSPLFSLELLPNHRNRR